MEEPLAAEPTLPRGGAHDKGDPTDMSGYEEAWTAAKTSADPTRVGTETAWDVPSSAVQDLPAVTEQATPTVALVTRMRLKCPVQAQQQPRRSPPRATATEVEEIIQEPAQPPQVLLMVIRRDDEFDMLKEGEASTETKRLRVDLSVMIG